MSFENWGEVKLRQFVDVVSGFAFPSENFTDGEGIPLIRIRDLTNQLTEVNYNGNFSDHYIVKTGDLLVGMDGDFITVRWKGDRALLNQRVCKLVSRDSNYLNQDFLFYRVIDKINYIHRVTSATTVKHLSSKDVLSIQIDLPNVEEQTKIAEVLSTIDRAIEQTEAIIAKQQRIKTGLMQDLLTKGIDEDGNVRSEATHKFKDSLLGRIPIEWNLCELDKIASYITSGSRWWAKFYSNEGAVFIRIGNLTREHINFRFDDIQYVQPLDSAERKRTAVQEGDLLISVTADLGIIGVIPRGFTEAYMNQHIALVRLRPNNVSPRFVGHYLASNGGQKQFEHFNESGAKSGLNLPTVGRICIALPNFTEQENISFLLDLEDQRISKVYSDLAKLKRMKNGLMQDLLTGSVRVAALLNDPKTANI